MEKIARARIGKTCHIGEKQIHHDDGCGTKRCAGTGQCEIAFRHRRQLLRGRPGSVAQYADFISARRETVGAYEFF
jgi:hypothetical protein